MNGKRKAKKAVEGAQPAKKRRKADKASGTAVEHGASVPAVQQPPVKKAKKRAQQPDSAAGNKMEQSIQYLHQWDTARETWKFRKGMSRTMTYEEARKIVSEYEAKHIGDASNHQSAETSAEALKTARAERNRWKRALKVLEVLS
eukprot:g3453.t1